MSKKKKQGKWLKNVQYIILFRIIYLLHRPTAKKYFGSTGPQYSNIITCYYLHSPILFLIETKAHWKIGKKPIVPQNMFGHTSG